MYQVSHENTTVCSSIKRITNEQFSKMKYFWISKELKLHFDLLLLYCVVIWLRYEQFKGGREEFRFRLSQHLRILLFIAGEPQELDK